MEILVDLQQLIVGYTRLGAYAFKAAAAGLEVGHPNRIFIRHPEGKVARSLGKQSKTVVAALSLVPSINILDRFQAIEIFSGIGDVLVVGKALNAGTQDAVACGREGCADPS